MEGTMTGYKIGETAVDTDTAVETWGPVYSKDRSCSEQLYRTDDGRYFLVSMDGWSGDTVEWVVPTFAKWWIQVSSTGELPVVDGLDYEPTTNPHT